ncbi:MAG: hypothetical protein L0Y44_08005 [Phycisphaerales bacterium]|nr:hypothetical protein [Phycisphaerales bacterium]MCI0630578.1 hypothetical protein [Phycisphaerales bacterium]MCI0676040.1 hypothetical protein [Phycisphaerales bacterium]
MRRLALLLVVLWLMLLAAIAVYSTIQLNRSTFAGSAYRDAPLGFINGEPAYILQRLTASLVRINGQEAWHHRELYLIPQSVAPRTLSSHTGYWKVKAIDKPFHLTFQKPDGSLTAPLAVQWTAGDAAWTSDGRSVQFSSGTGTFLQRPFRAEAPEWNKSVVSSYLRRQLVYGGFIGIALALVGFAIAAYRESSRHENHCESCGYDLRGSPSVCCPECGHRRAPV